MILNRKQTEILIKLLVPAILKQDKNDFKEFLDTVKENAN